MKKTLLLNALFLGFILVHTSLLAATSAENRRKLFHPMFGGLSTGLDGSTLIGQTGFLGGYFGDVFVAAELSSDLKANSNAWSFDGTSEGIQYQSDATYASEGIFLRWFYGNSANIKFGGRSSRWSGTMTTTKDISGSTLSTTGEVETNMGTLHLGFGNEWLTDFGLLFSIDWLTFQVPLLYEDQVTVTSSDPGYDTPEADLRKGGKLLNAMSSFPVGGLIFSMGIWIPF